MALVKASFAPGIDKQTTTYGAEGRWVDSKNVRFRTGLPEKIGGWDKVITSTLIGVARATLAWVSNAGVRHLAIGTDRKLYVYVEGRAYDITPIRLEAALTGPFAMTSGSPIVTVTHTSHGAGLGDFVTFDSFSTAQGLDMNQEFEITEVVDGNSYKITHTSNASGTASSQGGTGNAKYQINIGAEKSAFGFGWGTGTWNESTWNTPRSSSSISLDSSYWSLDTFGEDLLAIRNDDALYRWTVSGGLAARAQKIAAAPTASRVLLVSSPDRHVFLFGTETTVGTSNTQDDLFLRFSSQEDFNTWAPASTNTAGSFRIQDGSKIVCAKRSRGSILVWTDTALHALNNIGPPFIFGLNQVGSNCGAVSANSVTDVNGVTYWMSQTAFYQFDGAIKKLDCTVQDFVFDDINATSLGQVAIAVNTDFNEVTWFYPKANSDFLNASVTYNYLENVWYTNDGFVRTSWVDRGVYALPYATFYSPTNFATNTPVPLGLTNGATTLYEHEKGVNDDGNAMDCQITSGDFDIKEGDQVFLCSRVIPDFKDQNGETDVRIEFANYPASTNTRSFTSTTTPTTKFFSVRGRGRQANVKISSDTSDANWRFGTVRLDIQPDGRR
tara:strand:- start:4436 stop:6271 length:1836 start_codon:yes stop_codon:yes gene_type:complete